MLSIMEVLRSTTTEFVVVVVVEVAIFGQV